MMLTCDLITNCDEKRGKGINHIPPCSERQSHKASAVGLQITRGLANDKQKNIILNKIAPRETGNACLDGYLNELISVEKELCKRQHRQMGYSAPVRTAYCNHTDNGKGDGSPPTRGGGYL